MRFHRNLLIGSSGWMKAKQLHFSEYNRIPALHLGSLDGSLLVNGLMMVILKPLAVLLSDMLTAYVNVSVSNKKPFSVSYRYFSFALG